MIKFPIISEMALNILLPVFLSIYGKSSLSTDN